jgi:hypothetical protein
VKAASLDAPKALPWLPDKVAEAVYEKVHGEAGGGGQRPGPVEANTS